MPIAKLTFSTFISIRQKIKHGVFSISSEINTNVVVHMCDKLKYVVNLFSSMFLNQLFLFFLFQIQSFSQK